MMSNALQQANLMVALELKQWYQLNLEKSLTNSFF